MAEKVEKNNIENVCSIKEELKEDGYIDDKILVCETTINTSDNDLKNALKDHITKLYEKSNVSDYIKTELSSSEACNHVINSGVKVEDEISAINDIKIEFDNDLFLCDHCQEYYGDYCTKCGMLVHILNRNVLSNIDNRGREEIPNCILEIRDSHEQLGIYALKVLPKGVKLGPFSGLSATENCWRLKRGKFVVNEDSSKYLNWMQYINPARSISEQNLLVFQSEFNLYYRSIREIQVGEELLVYFGVEYEDGLNKDVELVFNPTTEESSKDVFACTYCCLGFSSMVYLTQHKSICRSKINETFSSEELTRCQFCKIYLHEKEYLECHMTYCCERNVRKCIPPALDNETVEVRRCNKNKYLKNPTEKKPHKTNYYKCEVCGYKANFKANLESHIKAKHLKEFEYKCEHCEYKANHKVCLELHIKTKHLKRFDYECEFCGYKTNHKGDFRKHVKWKHLKEFNYKCEMCEYKSNQRVNLENHMKTKHLREFKYECDMCEFKTNQKLYSEIHLKTKHLKKFDYECKNCEYKTNQKANLDIHMKSKHLKEFNYECEDCEYKTNQKINLESHVRSKHRQEFQYECKNCEYKTNQKANLKIHIKSKHLKEFNYECEDCEYKTNQKSNLKSHIKSKHLKEFNYECEDCEYKTNYRRVFDAHVRSRHLKEFIHRCEICAYKTNHKGNLQTHTKTVHLKEFKYKCEMCGFKTNQKSHLDIHIKRKHLKEFKPVKKRPA